MAQDKRGNFDVKRSNYFQGMMLVDKDFKDEQSYHRQMRQNHNLELHTWGVVRGLDVSLDAGGAVTVTEGLAIDASGREIWWKGGATQPAGSHATGNYLVIEWNQEERDEYPQMAGKHLRLIDTASFSWKSSAGDNDVVLAQSTAEKADNSMRRSAASVRANGNDIEIRPVTRDGALRFGFNAGAADQLVLKSNGNVGIGTNAPQVPLHIKFPGGARGNAGVLNLEGTDHVYVQWYPLGFAGGRKGWMGYGSANEKNFTIQNEYPDGHLNLLSASGKVGIGVTDPKSGLEVRGNVAIRQGLLRFLDAEGNWYADNWIGMANNIDGGTQWLHIGGITGADKVRRLVLAAGRTYVAGSLGIGTNAPGDALQVGSGTRKFAVGDANSPELENGTSYAGFNAVKTREGGQGKWRLDGDGARNGGALIYGDIFGKLRFVTIESTSTGSQDLTDTQIRQKTRMMINERGVGIGTEDIQARLRVVGGEQWVQVPGTFSTVSANDPAIYMQSGADVSGIRPGDWVVMNGEKKEVERVSPGATVVVKRPGFPGYPPGTPLYVVRPGQPILRADDYRGNLAFVISNVGNVGIGVADPGTNRLMVSRRLGGDDASALQHEYQLEIRNGIGYRALAIGLLDNGKGVLQAKESGVGYNDLLFNPVAGNVGIGTTTTGAKLDVNGDVKISGRIACGGWIALKTFHGSYVTANNDKLTMRQNLERLQWEQFTLEMACSREFKENISDISGEEAMATLQKLNPIKYDYKGERAYRQNLGFIAEEMPDNLASEDRKTVSPFEVIPILTRVAKEQQKSIARLRETIRGLQEKVEHHIPAR